MKRFQARRISACVGNFILMTGFWGLSCTKAPDNKTISTMSDFCSDIKNDNWKGVKNEVNAFLKTLNPSEDHNQNFQKIKDWLLTHGCVSDVRIQLGEIRTLPPIKEIKIDINTSQGVVTKSIGISFSSEKYEIDIY